MPVVGQDDKFYLTDTGGRIAKSGLSADKNKSYQDMLAESFGTPQMTLAPAQAPLMPTTPVAQSVSPFEAPAGDLTSLSQLNLGTPPPGQASLGQTPQLPVQPQAISPDIAKMYGEGIADINKGLEQQMLGNQKAANAEKAATLEINKQSQELTKQLEAQHNEMRLADLRRQQAMYDTEQSINTTLQEYDKAKIDPDRFFGGSTGKRLLAGIAIAFGEIGRALSGGQTNAALNIINQAIESDIEAQKENRTALAGKLTAQRQILSDMRTRLGDEQQSMLAQKVITIEMAQRKIDETARRYGTEKAQATAMALNGQLQQKKGELLTTLMGNAAEKATKAAAPNSAVATAEDNLRQEREKSEEYKKAVLRRDAYATMEAAANQASGPGDIALVFSYMKSLDPGSTVMQGEYANAKNAAGVDERVRAKYNAVLDGQLLSPNTRTEYLKSAKGILTASEKALARKDQDTMKVVKSRGLNPDMVFMNRAPESLVDMNQLSSLTIEGQPEKQRTKSANVMPGR